MSIAQGAVAASVPVPSTLSLSIGQEIQIEQVLGQVHTGVLSSGQAQTRIGSILASKPEAAAAPEPKAATPGPKSPAVEPFPKLDLSAQQKAQIEQIFGSAGSDGSSQADVRSQVDGVLTPTQRQQLQFLHSYTPQAAPAEPSPSYVLFANA